MRDVEGRAVTRNGKVIKVLLIRQLPLYGNPDRFEIVDERTEEVLGCPLLYSMADAAADCWLDGYGRGYDDGRERREAEDIHPDDEARRAQDS